MGKAEILETASSLAKSQGTWGRIYQELKSNKKLLNFLVKKQFKSPVDFVLFIENGE